MRLLIDEPADGVTNMARDEALLDLVGRGAAPPTLRFYRWEPPTISLGYFQAYSEFEKLPPPAGELAVVRRTTGGGAILHDREWTYSLALPASHPFAAGGKAPKLYELMHDALIDALDLINVKAARCGISDDSAANKGPFFCFERRHCVDVLIDGRKVAGSAQRRTKNAVLQHGSIILANRFDQHKVAAIQQKVYLEDEALLQPLIDALESRFGCALQPGQWSDAELALAEELKTKYASEEWTRKR